MQSLWRIGGGGGEEIRQTYRRELGVMGSGCTRAETSHYLDVMLGWIKLVSRCTAALSTALLIAKVCTMHVGDCFTCALHDSGVCCLTLWRGRHERLQVVGPRFPEGFIIVKTQFLLLSQVA